MAPPTVQRQIKITTTQEVLDDVPPQQEGFPMRKWAIEISMLNDKGEEVPATMFDEVIYQLHPTFVNPNRTFKKPPFRIEEQGWGEFDLKIVFVPADKGPKQSVTHDLNFQKSKYEVIHNLKFPTNRPGLAKLLAETGPVPGYSAQAASPAPDKRRAEEDDSKLKKKSKVLEKSSVDLERLAAGLQRLKEDDLIRVLQMVTDNKTSDMAINNNVDEGEFHMDLFTFPDNLLKSLWDFTKRRFPDV
ncbi:yeats family-domain-containing protein [Yarrowia lipolytica]|uniref:YALI0B18062p n=2 Tax=Yarrowia lipolytica TaxID=4952 RepID=Q6CE71_YARLI|nr:YALI0B18062p [Yarrowia lipolytica CLIB122]KAB8280813.1 yeats family-domain-containing protein [Yarrowia lipolytica]KAE8170053.1 yeats family-domain-containing protein [Yarrowia lipolytica]KAJ8052655.1 yeats family-domain-containing protein [Yarrowia lipolytica]QNP97069.1 Transcription initiation factor TFIID subunit 14 [Yarrowia lipolytica]RDW24365.1 yeats family-domain-containing protein [Yarrowia lipolytica]|eukprot:XP_501041.1 YALI0B18062p [Yarrowia lipolytica CLIB122]